MAVSIIIGTKEIGPKNLQIKPSNPVAPMQKDMREEMNAAP